jgi:hypothetical protein
MSGSAVSDRQLRDYLLGRLTDEARRSLEDAYFADQDLYDRLLEMQNDLIDAWARRALPPDERRAVEERLLSGPSGNERKRLAIALAHVDHTGGTQQAAVTPHANPRGFSAPLAVAATIAAIGVSTTLWLAMDNARLRDSIAATSAPAPAPTTVDRGSPAASTFPSQNTDITEIRLTAGVVRSEQAAQTIQVPPQARVVRLLLPTDAAGPSFVVGVERAGAGRIATQAGLTRDASGAVVVWIPAESMTAGSYEVVLWREREALDTLVATYVFRIVPRT